MSSRGPGIAPLLVGSISIDDVGAGKPDPEPYRKACEWLARPHYDVIAIEDSLTGLWSARQPGVYAVAFSNDAAALAEADVAIEDLRCVFELIEKSRF